jgi:hypothetical protein
LTKNIFEFFDSGGRDFRTHYYFKKLRNFHKKKTVFANQIQIQALASSLCGHFSILYGLAKSKSLSLDEYSSVFDSDLKKKTMQ